MIKILSAVLIAGLGILIYAQTFDCSFHFDDGVYIVNNPYIRDILDLPDIAKKCPCRFFTFLTFALDYHFHQLNVFGYHVFNVLVHVGTAILVWWFCRLTFSTPVMKQEGVMPGHADFLALMAGLVFVSHPVQTEAVTYIWQRTASLAAVFYLLSLCLYIQSRLLGPHAKIQGSHLYYGGSLLAAVVAMFTKENTITLPLMICLYEYSFFYFKLKNAFPWKRIIPFLLTIILIPLTILEFGKDRFQEINHVIVGPSHLTSLHYFLTQIRVMLTYIRLAFLPLHQNLDYDYPIFNSVLQPQVLVSLCVLTAIVYWSKRRFLKFRLLSFSIFWFFLTLLPESSFLPLEDVIYEHRLYLPMVGYSIFLVMGGYYVFGRKTFSTLAIFLSIAVFCYSILTFQRNKVWKDDVTLWSDVIEKSPHKARPYTYRGIAYESKKEFPQGIADFTKAIGIDPTSIENYNDRANSYFHQGDLSLAIADYTRAIALDPQLAVLYFNRGLLLKQTSQLSGAIGDFKKVIELSPKFIPAYYQRAKVYYQLKEYDKFRADVQMAGELEGRP